MENTMISPQTGEWTLRGAEGLRDYRSMKKTAVLAAKQAYGHEETQKGNIEMKRYNHMSGHRIRGWLMVIPIRLAAGLACLPLLAGSTLLAILYVLALGCCAALFCLRCRGFRAMYVGVAALGLLLGILALPDSMVYLIVQAAVEIALIPALYLSKRVKDTFFDCVREGSPVLDGWNGRRHEHSCYDVYMATYRSTK